MRATANIWPADSYGRHARAKSAAFGSVEVAPELGGDLGKLGKLHSGRAAAESVESSRRKIEPDLGARRFALPSNVRPAPGAALSNLRCILGGGSASGLGALGFLAATAGSRDWASLVLVSNRHVLLAHGASVGDAVFQPDHEACEAGLRFPRDRLNPVAVIEDVGFEGNYRFAYPGEPAASYFIDCATARLSQAQAPLGGGGPALFRCIARAHRFDTFAGRELRVRKLGVDNGLTGRLVDVAATVTGEDGERRYNTMVIRSSPARDRTLRPFAAAGDSGALVVDELDRAIGLVWGASLSDPALAYACHIHPVLDCLKLTPLRHAFSPDGEEKGR